MHVAARYEVLKELGRGAYGIVYEARDEVLDRPVALKTLRDDLVASDSGRDSFVRRFLREARASAKLNHPNIVAVYDAGVQGRQAYMAMEFVPGQTLRNILDAHRVLDVSETLKLAEQLLEALHYAHTVGVVHRDIKPENILVRADGILKVTDFGIAKLLVGETGALTRDTILGTPSYMAPEQVCSQPVDGRADLYSTSVVLYEMLTGRTPHSAESVASLVLKIVREPPDPMRTPRPVPREIQEAILRGLEKRPEQRFGTGLQFLEALVGRDARPHRDAAAVEEELTNHVKVAAEIKQVVRLTSKTAPAAPVDARATSTSWMPAVPDAAPSESGQFAAVPVPELLLDLRRRQESGLLVIESSAWPMEVQLSHGSPIGARGGPPSTALGPSLKRKGLLDTGRFERLQEEYRRRRTAEPKLRFGDLAVRVGAISSAQLLAMVEQQVDERIDALLDVDVGAYRFYRGLDRGEWKALAARPIEALLAQGLRRRPARLAQLLRRFLDRYGDQGVTARPEAFDLLPIFHFGPSIQRFLRTLEGHPALTVLSSGIAPQQDGALAFYLTWAVGALELQAPAAPVSHPIRVGSHAASTPLPLPAPSPPADRKLEKALRLGREAMAKLDFAEACRHFEAALRTSPTHAEALAKLGWATFRIEPSDERRRARAKELLRRALEQDPTLSAARTALDRIRHLENGLASG